MEKGSMGSWVKKPSHNYGIFSGFEDGARLWSFIRRSRRSRIPGLIVREAPASRRR